MDAEIDTALANAGAQWSSTEIEYAVDRAVADLSRVLPRQLVLDHTVSYTVTGESVILVGGTKALANQYIKYGSETVKDETEVTTYVRDTDYTMDYANGVITRIATGDIGATDTLKVSYTKFRVVIDMSSLTSVQRILRAEYPVAQVPQRFVAFWTWGDYLFIGPPAGDTSQERMSEGKHAHIYYLADHTAPTASAGGSYEGYLDSVVIAGAIAYCYTIRATQLKHDADGALNDADGAISDASNANAADGDLDTALDNAHGFLTSGGSLINTVNQGEDVAGHYGRYAVAEAEVAAGRSRIRDSYLAMAERYSQLAAQYMAEAAHFEDMARRKYLEFWAILNDRNQIQDQNSIIDTFQV